MLRSVKRLLEQIKAMCNVEQRTLEFPKGSTLTLLLFNVVFGLEIQYPAYPFSELYTALNLPPYHGKVNQTSS